jgi:hypothetical protein
VEFDQRRALFKDLLGARSLRAFLGLLMLPPGWRPDGAGETTEELRRRSAAMNAQRVLAP